MSITFYPAVFDEALKCYDFIDLDDEGLRFSNDGGYEIGRALGVKIQDGVMATIPIGEFINRCTNALRAGMRSPSRERPAVVSKAPGCPTMICGGAERGYLETRIGGLLAAVRRGQAAGATHVYAA